MLHKDLSKRVKTADEALALLGVELQSSAASVENYTKPVRKNLLFCLQQ